MRRLLVLFLSLVALLSMGAIAMAQETDDTADGATLETVTGDSASFFGQEVTLEGEVIEFLNPRIFVLGEGAALDDDKVLVINNTNRELNLSLITGERARLTGTIVPSFNEGGIGQVINNGIHLDGMSPENTGESTMMNEDTTTEPITVSVTLSEFMIDILPTVEAGPTTFQVSNNGTMEHSFVIEGNGMAQGFEVNLLPGETRDLQVDLQPGIYHIYCPVEDHEGQGMSVDLEVTQATGNTVTQPEMDANVQPTTEANVADPAAQPTTDPNAAADPNMQPTTDPNMNLDTADNLGMTDQFMPEFDWAVLENVIAERYPNYTILELTSMSDVEALIEMPALQ